MKKILKLSAISVVLGVVSFSPAFAHSAMRGGGGMMGMMGGGCSMMNMMGPGGMGPGYMQGGGMQGGMGQGGMMQGGMGQGGMMQGGGMGSGQMNSMTEGRLAFLKSELQITDAQKGVWDDYANAVRDRMDAMQGMRTQMMSAMQDGNAIDRMEARINGMQAMVDAMKTVEPATKKLYAALSDDQKKIADQLIGMDCGAM